MYPEYKFQQYKISGIWVEKKTGQTIYEKADSFESDASEQFKYLAPNYDIINDIIDKLVELRNQNQDNGLFVESVNAHIKFICARNFEKIKLPSDIEPCPDKNDIHKWMWGH